jgi:hypothetical protein
MWMFKTKPSGQVDSAQVRHGFCRYRDTRFNLDSHVVAVAEKEFLHLLDCIGCVSHARSRANSNTSDLSAVGDRSEVHRNGQLRKSDPQTPFRVRRATVALNGTLSTPQSPAQGSLSKKR